MDFIVKKASKQNKKLRISFSAVSGAGKTYSALKAAYGVCADWNKIYVIDTERESSSLYSDLGTFNIVPLEAPYSPQRYIQAINFCEKQGAEVIIIDSITHEWSGSGGCLEIHNKLGGDYKQWGIVTPYHNAFIDKILRSSSHVFCTVRRKEDYAMVPGKDGKMQIQKLGLGEETRSGFNYEMDIVFEIAQDTHIAIISKDRTNLFNEFSDGFIITEETGKILTNWANSGATNTLEEAMSQIRVAENNGQLTNIYLAYPELKDNKDFITGLGIKKKEFTT